AGPARCPPLRAGHGRRHCDLFHRARNPGAGGAIRVRLLAQQALSCHGIKRPFACPLLSPAAQPGGGAGHPNRHLTLKQEPDVPFRRTMGLTLGALGVVFGDIGTSPLYAMRESALAVGGHAASAPAVYGALSLIFWALVIVVT